ncbi:cytidine deaminase [Pseudoalteromonas sp. T1lg48]|uniref:cytidine deaminase n=1 Tax=Pseudoalteromonas sp. T1lg48 TaxID=2077100 RepID=UPI000CF5DA69|nr:cytidine deaminase [Pseudoalteromonas sp. T1lg48]
MSPTLIFESIKQQRGMISAQQFQNLAHLLGNNRKDTAQWLLTQLQAWAVAPISRFQVAALVHARNQQGEDFYAAGVNVELTHCGLESAVHAEQTALHNAWLNGATEIRRLYVSATPCGYCRQFINEFCADTGVEISIGEVDATLGELLPLAFGLSDLAVSERILDAKGKSHLGFAIDFATGVATGVDEDGNIEQLAQHVQHSYAPYSGGRAALMLSMGEQHFFGRYIENAAFNPSFHPLLAALSQVALKGQGIDFNAINAVTLHEIDSLKSHRDSTEVMVRRLAPQARFQYHCANNNAAAANT